MYFSLALFAYTVCCRRTEQCVSVRRRHKSDVVDSSSGRCYVTDQWHNVSLLRARDVAYIYVYKNSNNVPVYDILNFGYMNTNFNVDLMLKEPVYSGSH